MIRYKKYQMTGEKSPLKGLWYARPLIEDTSIPKGLPSIWPTTTRPIRRG